MKTEELINTPKSWFLDKTLSNPIILIKKTEVKGGDMVQNQTKDRLFYLKTSIFKTFLQKRHQRIKGKEFGEEICNMYKSKN